MFVFDIPLEHIKHLAGKFTLILLLQVRMTE